jgi:hypothetical protein
MKHLKVFELFSVNEGRYDKLSNVVSSDIFRKWKEDFQKGVKKSIFQNSYSNEDIEMDIKATLKFKPGTDKLNVDGGVYSESSYLEVDFEIDPSLLPEFWEEISMNLKDVLRHEIEHLTHGEGYNQNPQKAMRSDKTIRDMITMGLLPKATYFKLKKEVDAQLQGMYFRAKKERRPFGEVLNNYLDAQDITPDQKMEILNLWRKRLPVLNLPNF